MRKTILKHASNDEIKSICEICLNITRGNVKISEKCRRALLKYKRALRNISSSKRSLASKRKVIVNQSGGFVPALVAGLISSAVGALLNHVFFNKNKQS